MKSFSKKWAFRLSALVYLVLILLPVIPSGRAYAASSIEAGDLVDLSNSSDDDSGANKISDAIDIQFIDAAHVKVTLNLPSDQLLKTLSISGVSYQEAFSPTGANMYVDKDVNDSTYEWVQQNKFTAPDNLFQAYGVLKSKVDPKAGDLDINNWLKSENKHNDNFILQLFVTNVTSGPGATPTLYTYGDKADDGDGYSWKESNIANYYMGAGRNLINKPDNYFFRDVRYLYKVPDIVFIGDEDGSKKFEFCPTSAPIKHYFQEDQCGGGGEMMWRDDWATMTDQQVKDSFAGTGKVFVEKG